MKEQVKVEKQPKSEEVSRVGKALPILDNVKALSAEELAIIKRGYDAMKIKDMKKSLNLPRRYRDKHLVDFVVESHVQKSVEHILKAILADTSLYIYGDTGRGKTLLASVIANERVERLKPARWFDVVDFLTQVNPYYSGDSEESFKTRSRARRAAFLVLDDLGAEKVTETSLAVIFDVINARYNSGLQTVITSNYSLKELKAKYPGVQGSRIISRLEEMMTPVKL